jgi:formamidopyrimidine-DNA glycosylase
MLFFDSAPEKQRFEVARLGLDNGSVLVYGDARKFATLQLMRSVDLPAYLSARVGVDAMDDAFTPALFIEQASSSRQVAKGFLLDQKHFAGVGNIYADEALYQARVNPLRVISTLTDKEMRSLYKAVRSRLAAGIRAGGSSVSDYVQADGEEGKMQNQLKVYSRRGKPCENCGRPLSYTKVAGRGTVYCEHCQPLDPSPSK